MGARSNGYCRVKRAERLIWVLDFRYLDKDRRQQRFRRDAQVQSAEGARSEALMRQQWALTTGTPEGAKAAPTFAEFIDATFRPLHLAVKCRPATRERYEALLKQGILDAFGRLPLSTSFLGPMRHYVARLAARGIQARGHVSLVRTILRAAFDLGVVEQLPELPPLPKPGKKLPDRPGRDHVDALLARATGWLRIAVALAAYAGLRQGEVRALEVRDVDLTGNRLLIRRAFSADEVLTPKSSHERVVPLIPELRDVLAPALKAKLPQARVVLTQAGTAPRRTHVLSALKALEARAGLRAWSFHSLRHFFVSELVKEGASVEVVRRLAGHSKLDVTQRYVHAEASELRDAMALLSGQRVGNGPRTLS